MSTATSSASARTLPPRTAPAEALLENGDRLLAGEFLRRYERMPEVKKAELIDGIVYMPSPVRVFQHGVPDSLIQMWLGNYAALHANVFAASHATVHFDRDNVFQPDAVLFIDPKQGGSIQIDDRGYIINRPDLVVEVSASTTSRDLHAKFRAYRQHGVPEYLVWRVTEGEVDWFILDQDDYRPQGLGADGFLASRIFPGLRLPVAALLAGDRRALIDALK